MSNVIIRRTPTFKAFQPSPTIPAELLPKYGKGLGYPIRLLNLSPTRWEVSDGQDRINQSLYVILTTPLGTRLFRPDFGSNLPHLVFSTLDQTFDREAEIYTREAVEKWEPRITIEHFFIDRVNDADENVATLVLLYRVKGINTPAQFALNINLVTDPTFRLASHYTVRNRAVFAS